ncbi:hypothetical protein K9692_004517 [Escherichia coli]|nr:hypothetical protein [Escherichia coli]
MVNKFIYSTTLCLLLCGYAITAYFLSKELSLGPEHKGVLSIFDSGVLSIWISGFSQQPLWGRFISLVTGMILIIRFVCLAYSGNLKVFLSDNASYAILGLFIAPFCVGLFSGSLGGHESLFNPFLGLRKFIAYILLPYGAILMNCCCIYSNTLKLWQLMGLGKKDK